MKIKRSNPKAFETLNLRIKQLDGLETRIGWFESAKYDNSGVPVAFVAAIQELGSPANKIPPRPFIRPTIAEKKNSWMQQVAQDAKRILSGDQTPREVMENLGDRIEGDIRKTIKAVTAPPLSPITIELRAMKKRNPNLRVTGATVGEAARRVRAPDYITPSGVSTQPLNDTGHMIATLSNITLPNGVYRSSGQET